jgi:hypothetical protein
MRIRFSPVVVVALALALFSTLPAQAAPRFPVEPQGLLSQFLRALGKLPGRMVSVSEKEGSTVDPFGRGGTTPPPQGNGAVTGGPAEEPLDK